MTPHEKRHGAVAGVGAIVCAGNNPAAAKKRRRWSTAHEDALAPTRFGGKKQLRILGRHHPSSSSISSLASFHSNSNPVFEPSGPSNSSNNRPERLGSRFRQGVPSRFQSRWCNPSASVTLVTSAGDSSTGGAEQPHVSATLSGAENSDLESSLLANCTGGWRANDTDGWRVEDNGKENSPHPLLQSPKSFGAGACWGVGEARETTGNYVEEEAWRVDEGNIGVEGLPPPVSPILTRSDDGAQSIDGPRYLDDDSQEKEELSTLESCERRSRELLEKVQANAAEELAQFRAYQATINQLRAHCTKHEAAAKQYADLHRDAVAQLLSARDEITELKRERSNEDIAKEDMTQTIGIDTELRADLANADRGMTLTLQTTKNEQSDVWSKKVDSLEIELAAVRSDRNTIASALRDLRKDTESEQDSTIHGEEKKLEIEADTKMVSHEGVLHGDVDMLSRLECGELVVVGSKIVLESSAQGLSSKKLLEVQAQMVAACDEMEKLQRERNELKVTVLEGQRRVEEAQKERDDVVLAVQREWDSVKVALREEKENLLRELEAVREQKTMLQIELDARRNTPENERQKPENNPDAIAIDKREATQELEYGCGVLQCSINDKRVELGSASDGLISLRNENKKLEAALIEVWNRNSVLEIEREAEIAALNGLRDVKKTLEGELCDLRDEKTKLAKQREALIIEVGEERQKLESERAVVCKAMQGENKKLETEREVLIAMQAYLKKLEMKKDQAHTLGADEKRRKKSKQDPQPNDLLTTTTSVKMLV